MKHQALRGYANDIIYDAKGAYISAVPAGAKVLTSISAGDDYFKAGWWPNSSISKEVDYGKLLAKGKALAITLLTKDIPRKTGECLLMQSSIR